MTNPSTSKDAEEIRRHAERLAKALALLLEKLRTDDPRAFDAWDFAEDALFAWERSRR